MYKNTDIVLITALIRQAVAVLPQVAEIHSNLGGVYLGGGRFDLRLSGIQLPPTLHYRGACLITVDVEVEALLTKRFLGLANSRIFRAALVDGQR